MVRRKGGIIAACIFAVTAVAATAVPALAVDPVITIDPTPAWAQIYANNPPVQLSSSATSLDLKLPSDASAVLGKSVNSTLHYGVYNREDNTATPLFAGDAVADSSTLHVSIPIPQGLGGLTPGSMQYCHDATGNCSASTVPPQDYSGFVVVVTGTPIAPGNGGIFVQSGLTAGGPAGSPSVSIDLGLSQALPLTFFIQKDSTTSLASYTDKLIFRSVPGYFTSGPDKTWTNAFPYGYFWKTGTPGTSIDAQVSYSADGSKAIATVPTGSIPQVCSTHPEYFVMGVADGAIDAARYALAKVALGTPQCTQRFSDVPTNSGFYREIQWLASQGITTGYPDGSYGATLAVHRDAMAAFLYRQAGSPSWTPPANSPFVDMAPNSAFYKEVTWLAYYGITTGWVDPTTGHRSFRPGDNINRDAMAAFLYRFSGSPSWTAPGASPFNDITPNSRFYNEITWLAAARVSTGYTDGTFRPLNAVNRDAMAAFLYRWQTGWYLGTQ
ncbi:S-layer homology domain-containing protein [Arthrobacter sp. efr-133-TYG-118]|uniref:S-layer homology domain-containing protein n=1 Tax=Arthrobacter sp. efr-133-TYG-118 TaxID=3040279 RepID=UPI00254A0060|nr:S-layer homology domain-containing protein [Arthrobacter sp. efr-133-TYG-118]